MVVQNTIVTIPFRAKLRQKVSGLDNVAPTLRSRMVRKRRFFVSASRYGGFDYTVHNRGRNIACAFRGTNCRVDFWSNAGTSWRLFRTRLLKKKDESRARKL
jgi:hypothetical protein